MINLLYCAVAVASLLISGTYVWDGYRRAFNNSDKVTVFDADAYVQRPLALFTRNWRQLFVRQDNTQQDRREALGISFLGSLVAVLSVHYLFGDSFGDAARYVHIGAMLAAALLNLCALIYIGARPTRLAKITKSSDGQEVNYITTKEHRRRNGFKLTFSVKIGE